MLEAALWGFVGGAALLIGAVIGLVTRPKKRTVAFVMAFAAGVLVSAVAFDLTQEALELGGGDATTLGLVLGGLTFFAGDWLLDRRSGGDRRDVGPGGADGRGKPIALGALLDGIPESAAIGLTLLGGGAVSASFACERPGGRETAISALYGPRSQFRGGRGLASRRFRRLLGLLGHGALLA